MIFKEKTSVRKFRPDIQGLRAVAVIAVILSHFRLGLQGGFIGVDIFFVISGYLITLFLFSEAVKTKTISLKSFYQKRILRILPASIFVLLLTLIGSFFLLSPLRTGEYANDSFFAAISAVNWHFAKASLDYFNTGVSASPFLHYWSLAVEEQFYLIWPLIILLLTKIFKNKNKLKFGISASLLIIIIIGIYQSFSETRDAQPMAYFGLHTRMWQLALGSLLAIQITLLAKIKPTISAIISWIGAAGILASFYLISESTAYPGLWALLPTISTGLIIGAGVNFNKWSVEKILKNPILQWLGNISYSLYLIHWPLFVIVLYQSDLRDSSLGLIDKIGLVIVSLLLAHISYHTIENYFRLNEKYKNSFTKSFALGLILIMLASGTSFGLKKYIDYKNYTTSESYRQKKEKIIKDLFEKRGEDNEEERTAEIKEKVENATKITKLSDDVYNALIYVKESGYNSDCLHTKLSDKPGEKVCHLGDKESDQTILLLGDSHARQWIDPINTIAKLNNYNLLVYTKSACPMDDVKIYNGILKREYTECRLWRETVIEEIKDIKPSIIIYSSTSYEETTTLSYTNLIEELSDYSQKVFTISDTPYPRKDIPDCLLNNKDNIQNCSIDISIEKRNNPVQKKELEQVNKDKNTAVFINIFDLFCINNVCPPVINDIVVYQDGSHISDVYANYLTEILNDRLGISKITEKIEREDKMLQKVKEATEKTIITDDVYNSLDFIKNDFKLECLHGQLSTTPGENICYLGNTDSSRTIVLLGDSHALHWVETIDNIAKMNDYKLIVYVRSGCPIDNIDIYNKDLKREYTECYSWREAALKEVKDIKPDIIITSSLNYGGSSASSYNKLIEKLHSYSKRVIVISDTPHPDKYIPNCLSENKYNIQNCSFENTTEKYNQKKEQETIIKNPDTTFIKTTDLFCFNNICPPVIDDIVVYRDKSHISDSYATYLTKILNDRLDIDS